MKSPSENLSKIPVQPFIEQKEVGGVAYTVEKGLSRLVAGDLKVDDRAMVSTESGNRFLVRISQSKGMLMIHSERADFKDEAPLYVKGPTELLAEIGKPFAFVRVVGVIVPGKQVMGEPYTSTPVTGIEIRRGIEAAVRTAEKNASLPSIAGMLKRHAKEGDKT